jgi:hypothetical protein
LIDRFVSTLAIRDEVGAAFERLWLRVALLSAAIALWLLAVGFALAGLTTWLATLFGVVGALLLVAALAGVAAVVVHLILNYRARHHPSLWVSISKVVAPLREAPEEAVGDGDHSDSLTPKPAASTSAPDVPSLEVPHGKSGTRRRRAAKPSSS